MAKTKVRRKITIKGEKYTVIWTGNNKDEAMKIGRNWKSKGYDVKGISVPEWQRNAVSMFFDIPDKYEVAVRKTKR